MCISGWDTAILSPRKFTHERGLEKLKKKKKQTTILTFLHTHFSKATKDPPNLSVLIYAVYGIVPKWEFQELFLLIPCHRGDKIIIFC